MNKILFWLSGKKAVIVGLAGIIITYLTKENILTVNFAYTLQSIITLLAGGASIATTKAFAGKAKSKRN